jgi:parvulin-like peptidyl-prolyl isomerase
VPVSRRFRRVTAVAALAAATAALPACQSRIGAAAIVGEQRISDDTLQSVVQEALASPGVRDALPNSDYKGDLASYRRTVLGIEVERVLAETAAQRLGISVDEAAVTNRYRFYESQSGSSAQFAADLAAKTALSPALFRELVRTEVIESEIGYHTGGAKRPTEAELRSLYEQYASSATTATLSLIQVPNAAVARSVLARLRRDPSAFTAVAKEYADMPQTAADPQQYVQSRLPPDLSARLARANPGDVLIYSLSGNGTVVTYVIRFDGIKRPTLESSRPQLESQSLKQAAGAGQRYVATVANEVGVQVNPRYGSWDGKRLTITDFVNPVVKATPTPLTSGPPATPVAPGTQPTPGTTG